LCNKPVAARPTTTLLEQVSEMLKVQVLWQRGPGADKDNIVTSLPEVGKSLFYNIPE
jgi:alpha-D-ribose 1-methylphosphonate 5-triphosphate synthase subunit PhnH